MTGLRQRIRQDLALYLQLLTHSECDTRMAVTKLCAHFPDDSPEIIGSLKSAYEQESEPLVRANLVLAISIHGGDGDFFAQALATEKAHLPRLVCFAMAMIQGGTTGASEYKELVEKSEKDLWIRYRRLPMARDFFLDLVVPLVYAEPSYQEAMLTFYLDRKDPVALTADTLGLLILALFPQGDLTTLKRKSLDVISLVATSAWPDGATNMAYFLDELHQFNLPLRRLEMRTFLLDAYAKIGMVHDSFRESIDETTGNPFFDTFFAYMEDLVVTPKKPWWRFW